MLTRKDCDRDDLARDCTLGQAAPWVTYKRIRNEADAGLILVQSEKGDRSPP